MRKLLLLVLIPLFLSCGGSDDETNMDLSGKYISDEAGITEIYTLEMSEGTGIWSSYDKGLLEMSNSFTYTASGGVLDAKYSSGGSDRSTYTLSGNILLVGDVTYRKVPSGAFSSVSGHTYIAADWKASSHALVYDIYTFNSDGTLSLEVREDKIDGNIHSSFSGTYSQSGNSLILHVGSNNFTAALSVDFKTFTYNVYDISIGDSRTLLFYSYQ